MGEAAAVQRWCLSKDAAPRAHPVPLPILHFRKFRNWHQMHTAVSYPTPVEKDSSQAPDTRFPSLAMPQLAHRSPARLQHGTPGAGSSAGPRC